jgi:tRNA wybutosine-synthesizing protein 3
MDAFAMQKKQVLEKLYRPDKSKKGSVDAPLVSLIDLINQHPDFYTTSSCSGRISLFTDNNSRIKSDASWLFVTHEQANVKDILLTLNQPLPESIVWLRAEGLILHVCARDMEMAKKLVQFAQSHGFKKSTLLGLSKRFIVEILATQRIDAPVSDKGVLLVDESYIRFLTKLANKKLARTHEQIKELELAFKTQLL